MLILAAASAGMALAASETDGQSIPITVIAMREAMAAAYGSQATTAGQGGSIGLANTLNDASPQAELMLIGVEEPACLIHAPNESVDLKELERHTLSETIFLTKFAEHWKQAGK